MRKREFIKRFYTYMIGQGYNVSLKVTTLFLSMLKGLY